MGAFDKGSFLCDILNECNGLSRRRRGLLLNAAPKT
jgi:hypothetical protein